MAVLSKYDIMSALKERLAGDTTDEVLALIEDVNDTITDFEERVEGQENWRTKYEENDKEWRQKYKDRFFGGKKEEEDITETEIETPKPLTKFEELFKIGE